MLSKCGMRSGRTRPMRDCISEARVGIQMLAGQKAAAKSEAEQARALLEARLAERAPEITPR
jgi:hypothetical protein